MSESVVTSSPDGNETKTSSIKFDQFLAVDIRVGTILQASLPDWSDKLIELKVDFGQEIGQRTILAGLRKWYQPEDFIGKQSIFVVNLEPRRMGPGVSEGMILAAQDDQPESTPQLLLQSNLAPAGSRLG
jgi:methionine--tRNA ligase beta chain